MTGEAMREVLEKVVYLATNAANWRRDCGSAMQEADDARKERDEARREVERLKEELAAERAKKSGPVEGTWAWACEYVVKNRGKSVTRGNASHSLDMLVGSCGGIIRHNGKSFEVIDADILATDWRVVES